MSYRTALPILTAGSRCVLVNSKSVRSQTARYFAATAGDNSRVIVVVVFVILDPACNS